MARMRAVNLAVKMSAARLRSDQTQAEEILWETLRDRRLDGVKFRRQHAFKRFVLDFCAPDFRLAIELDGAVHDTTAEHDAERTAVLNLYLIRVIRFENAAVFTNLPDVVATIRKALAELGPAS